MLRDRRPIAPQFVGPDAPTSDELAMCVHCGFCLNACPTYLDLGVETDSPRGRLYLMRALHEQRLAWTPRVQQHFDQCLQCRACETACPSGVPYGRLMEATRADLYQQGKWPRRQRLIWDLVMRRVFPYPGRLRLAFLGLRLYQRSGLQALVRRTGLLRRLAPGLADLDALSPDATQPFFEPTDIERYAPQGAHRDAPRAHVAMLTGCVMPLTYPGTHHATARVLSRNGVRVVATPAQICCGALHAHGGDTETARRLARRNIDAFLDVRSAPQTVRPERSGSSAQSKDRHPGDADLHPPPPDAIIVNAAGCGSHMKEYGHLLRNDPRYAAKAEHFASLVRDVHEFLVELGIDPPTGRLDRAVTYQDSCHLVHAQRIAQAPRELLAQIPGLELREMTHPDRCCGSAGIYSIVQRRISRSILRDKMAEVNATTADQVCTANPGCMVQLDAGLRLFPDADGPSGPTRHVVDLLDESYRLAEGPAYADA